MVARLSLFVGGGSVKSFLWFHLVDVWKTTGSATRAAPWPLVSVFTQLAPSESRDSFKAEINK